MELSLKIDNILGHKACFNRFKKIEITLCIISDHNRIKLDLNNKRNPRKCLSTWRLKNILLKNQWVTEVIREEIKNFLEFVVWDTTNAMLRGKFIAISACVKKKKKPETSQGT
jgi:hypothetical protein